MPALRIIAFALLITFFGGCDKDLARPSADCNEFKLALLERDKAKLKSVVEAYIVLSGSSRHTAADLEKLSAYISKSCDVQASVACYACIKTLPEMSEMILRFRDGLDEVERVIDLSNKYNDDKMVFINVHQD